MPLVNENDAFRGGRISENLQKDVASGVQLSDSKKIIEVNNNMQNFSITREYSKI